MNEHHQGQDRDQVQAWAADRGKSYSETVERLLDCKRLSEGLEQTWKAP